MGLTLDHYLINKEAFIDSRNEFLFKQVARARDGGYLP